MTQVVSPSADLPDDAAGGGATPGERRLYSLLQNLPGDRFFAVHEPRIGRGPAVRYPDFVVLDREAGAAVIEVKDWEPEDIVRADPRTVTIRVNGREKACPNPLWQAEGCENCLRREAEELGISLPTVSVAVFPYLPRKVLESSGLARVVDPERTLCEEKLFAQSFLRALEQCMRRNLKRKWVNAASEFPRARQLVWPYVVIRPERGAHSPAVVARRIGEGERGCWRVARSIKHGGHWLLRGPAGSGKTSVLAAYCCDHVRLCARGRLLFVCYNIALRSYLERILLDSRIPLKPDTVRVMHFYQLCAEVLGEEVDFERRDPDYYADVVRRTREAITWGRSRLAPFDTVLVDEGQDFDVHMLSVLTGLLAENGLLVLAEDPQQNLYRSEEKRRSWAAAGLDFTGRRIRLGEVFRCTRQIREFARAFLDSPDASGAGGDGQLSLFPRRAAEGPPPQVIVGRDREDVAKRVAEQVARLRKGHGDGHWYPLAEIAVIYDDKRYGGGKRPFDYGDRGPGEEFPGADESTPVATASPGGNCRLGEKLWMELRKRSCPAVWVSRDRRAKEEFDVSARRVAVLSVHSAKGFDFDAVFFVAGAEGIGSDALPEEALRAAYVGITRARHRLVVAYWQDNALTRRLREAQARARAPHT